jgi:hypothetical protein
MRRRFEEPLSRSHLDDRALPTQFRRGLVVSAPDCPGKRDSMGSVVAIARNRSTSTSLRRPTECRKPRGGSGTTLLSAILPKANTTDARGSDQQFLEYSPEVCVSLRFICRTKRLFRGFGQTKRAQRPEEIRRDDPVAPFRPRRFRWNSSEWLEADYQGWDWA